MAHAVVVEGRRGFVLSLRDGMRIFYAPVGPEDEQRLRVGLKELSPGSRYLRFFSPTTELSEEQIHRFTHPNQQDHVAWGGLALDEPGLPGLGLGRMVRDEREPSAAEFAVAVIDRCQNKGMGTTLLAVLCVIARQRQISELTALVLPENEVALDWFVNLGADVNWRTDACEVRLAVPGATGAGAPPGRGVVRLETAMRQVEAAAAAAILPTGDGA
jgi:acetyltransferase